MCGRVDVGAKAAPSCSFKYKTLPDVESQPHVNLCGPLPSKYKTLPAIDIADLHLTVNIYGRLHHSYPPLSP